MSEGFRVTIQVLKANLQPIFMDVKTPLCPQLKGNSLEKAHQRLGPGKSGCVLLCPQEECLFFNSSGVGEEG